MNDSYIVMLQAYRCIGKQHPCLATLNHLSLINYDHVTTINDYQPLLTSVSRYQPLPTIVTIVSTMVINDHY